MLKSCADEEGNHVPTAVAFYSDLFFLFLQGCTGMDQSVLLFNSRVSRVKHHDRRLNRNSLAVQRFELITL